MEEKNTKKSSFVPSYAKKGEETKSKKKSFKIKSKISIIIIASILVLIIAAIIGISIFVSNLKYEPYKKYEEDMKTYVFDIVYDNKTAKTSEKVTKSEAIKMVLAAVFNTSDISGFAKSPTEDYENAIWVQYAVDRGIIAENEITKDNYNKKATYIDVIRYFAAAKTKILEKNLDDTNVKIKDINTYTPDEQVAIKDMVYNNIFELKSNKVNGRKKIFKGQLNEMIKHFVEKYNTITLYGEKLNINPDKIPSNATEYPYTLASVDKSVYEIPFSVNYDEWVENPKSVFIKRKELYSQIKEVSEGYYNIILNIDYRNIDPNSFKENLQPYMLYTLDDVVINEYVEYVRKNHIIISGKATIQLPAVYNDGYDFRARMRLQFEIASSDTNSDLLYYDLTDSRDIVYSDKKYDVYVDTYLGETIGTEEVFNLDITVYNMLLNKEKVNIKLEGE